MPLPCGSSPNAKRRRWMKPKKLKIPAGGSGGVGTTQPKVLIEVKSGQKIIWKDTGRTVPGTVAPSTNLHIKG